MHSRNTIIIKCKFLRLTDFYGFWNETSKHNIKGGVDIIILKEFVEISLIVHSEYENQFNSTMKTKIIVEK